MEYREYRITANDDYYVFNYYFDSMENTLDAVVLQTTTGTVLSVLCIILNVFLVYFLLREDEFRDLKLFSLYFQAIVDIVGPGVANCVFDILVYYDLRSWWDLASETESLVYRFNLQTVRIKFAMVDGSNQVKCIINFFRLMLNEYSTGWCIAATAFVRYVLVCHPTRSSDILLKKWLITIACFVVLIPVCSILVNTLWLDVYDYFSDLVYKARKGDYGFDYDYDYYYFYDYFGYEGNYHSYYYDYISLAEENREAIFSFELTRQHIEEKFNQKLN